MTVNGFRYATLDDAAASDATVNQQGDALPLPNGWAIAPNEANVFNVAGSFPWGAQNFICYMARILFLPSGSDCLVLSDGTLATTQIGGTCAEPFVSQNGQFRVKSKRVLIRQPGAVCSDFHKRW